MAFNDNISANLYEILESYAFLRKSCIGRTGLNINTRLAGRIRSARKMDSNTSVVTDWTSALTLHILLVSTR